MKRWTPFERVESTRPDWAQELRSLLPDEHPREIYQNSRYVVLLYRIAASEPGWPELIHLSIRSQDRTAQHDWRDFQRIKNELLGAEAEAIELYPAESRMVDSSNQFHLWCIEGMKWPFGFNQRLVLTGGMPNTVQRPWEEESKPADAHRATLDELKQLAQNDSRRDLAEKTCPPTEPTRSI